LELADFSANTNVFEALYGQESGLYNRKSRLLTGFFWYWPCLAPEETARNILRVYK